MTQKSILKMAWELGAAAGNCPHQNTGIGHEVHLPDYAPLSRSDIVDLLTIAKTFASQDVRQDERIVLGVQIRLNRGIPGMVCPREIDGPASQKMNELDKFFVEHYREGATKANVDTIFKLTR